MTGFDMMVSSSLISDSPWLPASMRTLERHCSLLFKTPGILLSTESGQDDGEAVFSGIKNPFSVIGTTRMSFSSNRGGNALNP
jgi:hypothetical protein